MTPTTVREKPILFSGSMVKAILDGRKIMTRRVVKHRESRWEVDDDGFTGKLWPYWPCYVYGLPEPVLMPCPYGEVGDRLWVRESICFSAEYDNYYYSADSQGVGERVYRALEGVHQGTPRSVSSIHMPRWASRITLEITDVRVERVQDISEENAKAEGFTGYYSPAYVAGGEIFGPDGHMPIEEFRETWDALNRKRGFGWEVNPWAWCISFRRIAQ